MKKIHFIISFFVLAILLGCANDNSDIDLDGIAAPENISALTTITQDNSGKVTIIPKGEGVTQYEIYFGDGTTAPAFVSPGSSVDHVYTEGVFPVRIVAMAIDGQKTEVTQSLTVSFLAPTNLNVTISPVVGNNMAITAQATANLETFFQVYYTINIL